MAGSLTSHSCFVQQRRAGSISRRCLLVRSVAAPEAPAAPKQGAAAKRIKLGSSDLSVSGMLPPFQFRLAMLKSEAPGSSALCLWHEAAEAAERVHASLAQQQQQLCMVSTALGFETFKCLLKLHSQSTWYETSFIMMLGLS